MLNGETVDINDQSLAISEEIAMLQPIGILGGTFDPIHKGHIHIANEACKKLPLEIIKFLPCYLPVHREAPISSPIQRATMVNIAIKNHSHFELDTREIDRREPSFMIDTLISLRQDYPLKPLCLLLGSDAYMHLTSWKSWDQLLNYAHLIIIQRPTYFFEKHPASILKKACTTNSEILKTRLAGTIHFLAVSPCPVSATLIRERVQQGLSIAKLVPLGVADYIQANHLYKNHSEG